jgi:hypothetical protein
MLRTKEGYPPEEWEGLKSEPTDAPDIYRLRCIPFFAHDIAYDNDVIAEKVEDRPGPDCSRQLRTTGDPDIGRRDADFPVVTLASRGDVSG